MVLICALLTSTSYAKPIGWLQHGASRVELEASTDLVLYRGPETQHLPAIAVSVPVDEGKQTRRALAVVDLAGQWSTMNLETANALGVRWEWEEVRGTWRRLARVERLEAGGLTLHDLHLEVRSDGAAGFVLGMTTLGDLAVALLPSEGMVRVAPASAAEPMLTSIATPIEVSPQPSSSWTEGGATFRGDGRTLRVPGALRWGAAVSEGTFHVRTSEPVSKVAPSRRLPAAIERAGQPSHDVEARLGDAWLDHTWIVETETLSDPDPLFAASLGYDVLYGLDIAVAGDRMAFAKASQVTFTPARVVAVEMARERFEQEEKERPTEAPVEGRVQIGFDGPLVSEGPPLGDPGDPVIRDRNLDLADTLWFAGKLDDALPHYLAASQVAGDHCLTHLRLAQRRLAWSGSRQSQSFVQDLIRQPLERSGRQWDTWMLLGEGTQEAIAEGLELPDAPLQVFQPPECQQSWGLLYSALALQGNDEAREVVQAQHGASDPSVAYAQALQHIREGQPARAEFLLAVSKGKEGVPQVDALATQALAMVRTSPEKVRTLVEALPQYRSDHELTTAFAALEAGRELQDVRGVARALRRSDPRWVPGALVASIALGEELLAWDDRLAQRWADSPQVDAWRAVHQALSGDLEKARAILDARRAYAVADWWTAKAVVSWLSEDESGRVEALQELHLRFPLLPGGELGTLPISSTDEVVDPPASESSAEE